MASAVCQGLQSCLEPPLTESTVLTHKSSSKPSQLHQKPNTEANSVIDDKNGERVSKNNGFSFFNVLENPSSNSNFKNEEVYVHPMVKRSASTLSTMSLEMCTESLGTETGSDVSESSDELNWEEREMFRSKARNLYRKVASRSHRGGFPPPLTSISGSDGTVKVSPHREGGRLVIKAVSVSDCGTKFEAERTDGRLKLSLSKDCCENVETGRANKKKEGGEEESCDGDVEDGGWWREVDGRNSNSKRPTRVAANSFDQESTEFRLRSCKDGGNGNKGIGNWSLFRPVVIS
ncbi:unnamed protein product [Lactuca saligna]|uniref:FAF domain-containing protein n=1 Tax=Lactuca saligna TaxID=75948 RepID=A0AA36EKY8_LACSI|nr:unnamed protein product [Lactuca saligna]